MASKALCLTVLNRPQYTEQTLNALLGCYGIEDYHVFIAAGQNGSAECNRVEELVYDFHDRHPGDMTLSFDQPQIGIDLAKLKLLPMAFREFDYCIFLEDDTPPSRDALRYFEAMNQMFRDDIEIACCTGYNRYCEAETHERVLREEPYCIDRSSGFSPWGWAMWRRTWESIMGDGSVYRDRYGEKQNGSHDNFWETEIRSRGLWIVYPVVPRTNHVGWEDAVHTPSRQHLMDFEYCPFGAWSQEMPDPIDVAWKPKWHES